MVNRRYDLQVCLGSSCFSRGNRELVTFIRDYLKKNHLDDRVVLRGSRCMGNCSEGPVIVINGNLIKQVGPADIEKLLDKEFGHLI